MALALAQLDDPAFLRAVLQSVAAAVAAVLALAGLMALGGMELAWLWAPPADPAQSGWLAWAAGAAGFLGAVERRHYPALPAAQPASLAAQAWDGVALGAMVLAMQVLALLVSLLIPGLGLAVGWFVTAWAIGRGLFMAVALRRGGAGARPEPRCPRAGSCRHGARSRPPRILAWADRATVRVVPGGRGVIAQPLLPLPGSD
jgi:CysZ protein